MHEARGSILLNSRLGGSWQRPAKKNYGLPDKVRSGPLNTAAAREMETIKTVPELRDGSSEVPG
jgi:hypothetical protein